MATYTESKDAMDDIAGRVVVADKKFINIGGAIDNIIANIDEITVKHADAIAELTNYVGSDVAWNNLKAEKDNMTPDFVATKNKYVSLKAAYDALI